MPHLTLFHCFYFLLYYARYKIYFFIVFFYYNNNIIICIKEEGGEKTCFADADIIENATSTDTRPEQTSQHKSAQQNANQL